MKLTTTLKRIKAEEPCTDGWKKLCDYLGVAYPEDKEINLQTILKNNGTLPCIWALRATIQDSTEFSRLVSIALAESVLYIFEKQYPDDRRPRRAIEAVKKEGRNYLNYNMAHSAALNARDRAIVRDRAWMAGSARAAREDAWDAVGATRYDAWHAAWAEEVAGDGPWAASDAIWSMTWDDPWRAAWGTAWGADTAAIWTSNPKLQQDQYDIVHNLLTA